MFVARSFFRAPLHLLLGCSLAMAGALAAAENDSPPTAKDRIEELRDQAEHLRDKADTTYQKAEAACYDRFLVNSCIDDAKATRLETVKRARALEAEAHKLDLAERQRAAATTLEKAQQHGIDSRPVVASPPGTSVVTPLLKPSISDERRYKRSKERTRDARARSEANAREAARRAEAARHARERYDARIRELEEKKARDADGR